MDTINLGDFIYITDKEFQLITRLVYDKFGINLTEKKKNLVMGRLNKLVKQMGLNNFMDYYEYVVNDKTNYSLLLLIDKISTNHTYFFREPKHFDYLYSVVLPEMAVRMRNNEKKEIKIWCAGCATGEEAYTISMIINEYFDKKEIVNWDIGILATDISVSALNVALKGVYNTAKTKGIPPNYRLKYFNIIDRESVEVNENIRKSILFKRLNLKREVLPFRNKFDIIFCRNVMIYFDNETKNDLINRLRDQLKVDGYLFIGHSESIRSEDIHFKYLKPAVYKKINPD